MQRGRFGFLSTDGLGRAWKANSYRKSQPNRSPLEPTQTHQLVSTQHHCRGMGSFRTSASIGDSWKRNENRDRWGDWADLPGCGCK